MQAAIRSEPPRGKRAFLRIPVRFRRFEPNRYGTSRCFGRNCFAAPVLDQGGKFLMGYFCATASGILQSRKSRRRGGRNTHEGI